MAHHSIELVVPKQFLQITLNIDLVQSVTRDLIPPPLIRHVDVASESAMGWLKVAVQLGGADQQDLIRRIFFDRSEDALHSNEKHRVGWNFRGRRRGRVLSTGATFR